MKNDGLKDGDQAMKVTNEQLRKIINEEIKLIKENAKYEIIVELMPHLEEINKISRKHKLSEQELLYLIKRLFQENLVN